MSPQALLAAATDLVHQVLRLEHPADRVVADFFRAQRSLGVRDRHVLAETVFALLRRLLLFRHLARLAPGGHGEIDRRLAILAWRGDEAALRAALDERERDWLARCHGVDLADLPAPLRHNLPDWLAEPLQATLGTNSGLGSTPSTGQGRSICASMSRRPTSTMRSSGSAAPASMRHELRIPRSAFASPASPSLQNLDMFDQGLVEVQDEGSQLLALLAGARRGEMVVDFCAGAGGKTLVLGA